MPRRCFRQVWLMEVEEKVTESSAGAVAASAAVEEKVLTEIAGQTARLREEQAQAAEAALAMVGEQKARADSMEAWVRMLTLHIKC